MGRDAGLEELVAGALGDTPGVTGKAMFGGWAFLVRGNLLCGVRSGSLMLRVGPANEAWAVKIPGVEPVVMGTRRMRGYVRAGAKAYGDDGVRARLMEAAIGFVGSLPAK